MKDQNQQGGAIVRKRALVIPAYYYSSNPLFLSIKDRLPEWDFVYFYSKDTPGYGLNAENISYDKVGRKFDEYHELEYDPWWLEKREPDFTLSLLGKLRVWVRHLTAVRSYARCFKRQVDAMKPDLAILPSDMTFSARLLRKSFPDLPIVVVQPNFLDFRDRGLRYRFAKRMFNLLTGVPFYERQPYFGLEIEDDHLLVWGEKSVRFYQSKRGQVHRITNPEHCLLLERVEQARRSDPFRRIREFGDLDPERKTVVIFIGSFVSLYGEEFQRQLNREYLQVLDRLAGSFNVVLKVHPTADRKPWEELFEKHLQQKQVLLLQSNDNFYELLSIADVNISTFSYAGFQAALAGSISINLFPSCRRRDSNSEWVAECSALNASTAEELCAYLALLEYGQGIEMENHKKRIEVFTRSYLEPESFQAGYWEKLFASFLSDAGPQAKGGCDAPDA